jgi:hypothetical protein
VSHGSRRMVTVRGAGTTHKEARSCIIPVATMLVPLVSLQAACAVLSLKR